MKKNSVVFKGNKNGIAIILDAKIPFEELKDALIKKVKDTHDFFYDANASISFKGRSMTEDEEMQLLKIVSEQSGLDIDFVNKAADADDELKKHGAAIAEKILPQLSSKQNVTQYHIGSVRNGSLMEFAGSIVIIGDVNPGAEIKAEGNIIVLGKLKGNVHAGSKGMSDCFVSALYMKPTQLIINDVITYFPDMPDRKYVPEYAYVRENQIVVEPLLL